MRRVEPLRLRELARGRITVMSFIYTRCAEPSACPYATGVLSELHEMSIGNLRSPRAAPGQHVV